MIVSIYQKNIFVFNLPNICSNSLCEKKIPRRKNRWTFLPVSFSQRPNNSFEIGDDPKRSMSLS